jgi:uncharacterized membrane protein
VSQAPAQIGLAVEPLDVALRPGEETNIEVQLSNRGGQADDMTVTVSGLPGEWLSTSGETLHLAPGDSASLVITIHPPAGRVPEAGDYAYEVTVAGAAAETGTTAVEGAFSIPPVADFTLDLDPPRWRHGESGRLIIRNQGNIPLRLIASGHDPDDAIRFGERHAVVVGPGEEEAVEMTPEAREGPSLVRQRILPFTLRVLSEEGTTREVGGELVLPSRLALGALLLVVAPFLLL